MTGADIVISGPSIDATAQLVEVAGGTSVAAPLLAGMSAAHEPTMTASLDGTTISTPDVTPSALALLPAGTDTIEQLFIVRPVCSDTIFTYGVDTSLAVTTGWDNETGYGQPHGLPFLLTAALLSRASQLTDHELEAALSSR